MIKARVFSAQKESLTRHWNGTTTTLANVFHEKFSFYFSPRSKSFQCMWSIFIVTNTWALSEKIVQAITQQTREPRQIEPDMPWVSSYKKEETLRYLVNPRPDYKHKTAEDNGELRRKRLSAVCLRFEMEISFFLHSYRDCPIMLTRSLPHRRAGEMLKSIA